MISRFKNILISEMNYNLLKQLGSTGEGFNDVITDILNNAPSNLLELESTDDDKFVTIDSVQECLTEKCSDCTGFYINKTFNRRLQCKHGCHEANERPFKHNGSTESEIVTGLPSHLKNNICDS
jgi:hypothetical protein